MASNFETAVTPQQKPHRRKVEAVGFFKRDKEGNLVEMSALSPAEAVRLEEDHRQEQRKRIEQLKQPSGEEIMADVMRDKLREADDQRHEASKMEERLMGGERAYMDRAQVIPVKNLNKNPNIQHWMSADQKNAAVARQLVEQYQEDAQVIASSLAAMDRRQAPQDRFAVLVAEEKKKMTTELARLQNQPKAQNALDIDVAKQAGKMRAITALEDKIKKLSV